MNLEFEILKEHSKRQTKNIADWIGKNQNRFDILMDLFLHGEYRIVQRSAWIVSSCAENYPKLILPWLRKIIAKAQEKNVHDAVKRNVVRLLQFITIPKSLQGKVVNLCFSFLYSPDEPIAVKVFSMTVLTKIALSEPDLKREVVLAVEEILPYGGGGIRSRGKKVLKELTA